MEMASGSRLDGESGSFVDVEEDGSNPASIAIDEDSNSLLLSESLCKKHGKKIEAFCEKDYGLLCIDCILSDKHKNHEIVAVAKASEKHTAFLKAQLSQSSAMTQKLVASRNEIQRHVHLMRL